VIKTRVKLAYARLRRKAKSHTETALLLQGKDMAWQVANMPPNLDFRKVGFKVFSQWDEDGIIQYLVSHLPIANKTFIEFGVENYEESNTRFLLMNDHWQGMVMDACEADIHYIQTDEIYWQYDLQAKCTWITRENIDSLLCESGFGEDVGLLSIDIDGNDYWIWEAVKAVQPRIVIVEYNSLFGLAPISIPYSPQFARSSAHYSHLYFGCSLPALCHLARNKGYICVGSNIAGCNAFFVRSDVSAPLRELRPEEAYVWSSCRDSRDDKGKMTYLRDRERVRAIEHLPVVNVVSGQTTTLRESITN
jgi:hypothetical protein